MRSIFYIAAALVLSGVYALAVCTLPAAFPTAANTGVNETDCPNWEATKTSTSGRTITADDTVISYEDITGQMTISASDVTIECSRVDATFTSTYGITCLAATCPGLLVRNVEIKNCKSACGAAKGVSGNVTTWRKVYLHDTERDLLKIEGHTILEDSYLQAAYSPPPEAHNDAIQTASGDNITIRRNRIEGPTNQQTSAYICKTDSGTIDKVLMEDNLLSGGSYAIYFVAGSFGMPSNVVVRNNTWVNNTSQFGPFSIDNTSSCLEWFGNTYQDLSSIAGPAGTELPGTCLNP